MRNRGVLAWILVLGACSASCAGDPPAECVDRDVDGYGPGCALGEDCDEDNALRNVDCDAVPPPDCAANPVQTGCPCLPASRSGCYAAPDETAGVGVCRRGTAICIAGHWGLCDGAVLPRGEICDDADQDCDGLVDEGVRSPCGACTPGCDGAVWGDPSAPFEPAPGVAVGAEGELTLAWEERVESTTVWIANSADDTISRIDAIAAIETARYDTGGDEPSRVAVDYVGDAWVANRELDGGVASVTKIAGAPERCVDRDGDGVETSSGPLDVLPRGEDECVLFTVPVGDAGGVARALAIDGDTGLDGATGGNAWVGMHDGEEVIELDAVSGAVLDRIATPGLSPYAAAFDAWGTLWVAERDGYIARIDRHVRPRAAEILEVPFSCYLLYGLAVDRPGRVYATGFSCDDAIAYEPARDRFTRADTEPSGRGAAVQDEWLWVAHTGGLVSRLAIPSLETDAMVELASAEASPLDTIGIGIDGLGQVWAASESGAPSGLGVATRVSPETLAVTAQVPVGRAPHTQGDLTGAALNGGFVPEGSVSRIFDGCVPDAETEWRRVHVEALVGPAGSVEVSIRHAADRAGLAAASFTTLGTLPGDAPPFDLSLPDRGVVEVSLRLTTTARDGAPRVLRVGIEWFCPGPG